MAGKKKNGGVSKAQFVRDNPNMPAKEVVAKAKAAGIELSEPYVYNVRATTKAGPRKRTQVVATVGTAPRVGRPPKARTAQPETVTSTAEFIDLITTASRIGIGRSTALLKAIDQAS